ncbi:Histidine kinase [Caprobacter fermentans]|uniref:histidine kinase n=1 Tax=Caproicibacter fermentans TaxID=2576756 RepID=A0A6N8I0K9_9FIRM|nr:sensor histidine kinase [Caproicibacter fermentans]MVB11664.1 Histidine kinase [Caproicibacter fermentans]
MKKYFFKLPNKLSIKIPLAYFFILILTVTLSSTALNKLSSESAQKRVNQATVKTITSIKTNVDFMIEDIDNYSKMMLSDNNLQNLLRQGNIYSNLQVQSKVSYYFYNLMQAEPIIDSVNIFDNSGNCFSIGKQISPAFNKKDIKDASWYRETIEKKGKYILRLNGSGAFSSQNGNFVSFIRQLRDVNTMSSLGIMVINIPESAFLQAYSNVVNDNSMQVVILDENNKTIVPSTADIPSILSFKHILLNNGHGIQQKISQGGSGCMVLDLDSQKYIISYLSDEEQGWKYISLMPYGTAGMENKSFVLLAFLLLLINGVVFFVSSVFISENTITPIRQLLQSMKNVNEGRFIEVKVQPQNYEFGQLFNGYNAMIRQIHKLLDKIIEEQKTIRKAELNTLQAQIKPHFLYNTLDSISSLALSGESEKVCGLVESLGNYYRISVSKGRDIISIGEEIEMVRNYLSIQKVRYQDLFEAEYEIEDSCLKYPILKLVLQPLVENALYHGIRRKGTSGIIKIAVRDSGETVCLCVADNGIGMSREEIGRILNQEKSSRSKSFGLWGTMERIRIFYGSQDCVQLESEPGKGTRITIIIPKGEG